MEPAGQPRRRHGGGRRGGLEVDRGYDIDRGYIIDRGYDRSDHESGERTFFGNDFRCDFSVEVSLCIVDFFGGCPFQEGYSEFLVTLLTNFSLLYSVQLCLLRPCTSTSGLWSGFA